MKRLQAEILDKHLAFENDFVLKDYLDGVVHVATLLRETETVRDRLRADVFDLFVKEKTGGLAGEGLSLQLAASVVAFNKAENTRMYVVEATIQLSFPSKDGKTTKQKKRKRDAVVGDTADDEDDNVIHLQYKFEECEEGDRHRDPGVPVLQSPCKLITLHISCSRGRCEYSAQPRISPNTLSTSFACHPLTPPYYQNYLSTHHFTSGRQSSDMN